MDHISSNTFVRAFSTAPALRSGNRAQRAGDHEFSAATASRASDLAQAAGNYENTIGTKIAMGVVALLTIGIGYGIIRLIEHCCNVHPKIDEFREAAVKLRAAIQRASEQQGGNAEVSISTRGGQQIKFRETVEGVEIVDTASNRGVLPGLTLEDIEKILDADINANGDAYHPYVMAESLLPARPDFRPFGNSGVTSNTEAFERRFSGLSPDDKTLITKCKELQGFMRRATAFLSREGHQRFSEEVANFLTGNASQLPEGLAVPDPAIPTEVKNILRDLLRISENELPGKIFDKVDALAVKVFLGEVDNIFSSTDSTHLRLVAAARNRHGADSPLFSSPGSP